MPALRKGIAKYFLTIVAIVFSLLLVSVFLFSKFYLAEKVQSLVVDISREKGYEVKIGDIAFGFLAGLEVENIEIFDSTDLNAYPIKIGELIIKPDITSSIIKGKMEIEEIVINDADLSLPKVGFEKLKKLITELGQERLDKEEEGFFSIGIKKIELNMAKIEVSDGVKLYISKLDFRLRDYELEDQKNIDIKGNITISDNQIDINGFIKTSSNQTNSELNIDIAELKVGSLSEVLEHKEDLSLHADLNFQITETISSSGKIKLENGEESTNTRPLLSTELLYDITYDKRSDTLLINTFDFEIGELLVGKFDGSIDRVTAEGVFNINGSAYSTRLEDIAILLRGFSNIVASGGIEAKDLKLTGSLGKDDVTFSGKAVLIGVDFDDSERDIKINKLGGSLDFKKIISRRESSGLSIKGKLNSKNVVTKLGLWEDLNADLEFKTNSRWNSSELSFSLNDLNLNIGLSDKIKISNLKTKEPINISFTNTSDKSLSEGENRLRRNKVSFMSRGLTFEKASWKGYTIEKGAIDDLIILYGIKWEFYMAINGSGLGLSDRDEKIFIDRIRLRLSSDHTGESGLKGNVNLKDGRYDDFKFPSVTSDYAIENDELKLINLKARLEGLGELKANETVIIFGGRGDRFSSKIEFSQASFSGPNYGIESKGMGGEFIYYNGKNKKTDWDGNVFVDEIDIKSQSAKKVSLKLASSSDGIKIDDLEGSVLGGRLGGSLLLNINKPLSFISSSFMIEDANIPYKSNVFFLERMVFDFKGTLGKGLTPQGEGELRIEKLRIGDNKKASSIRSGVKIQTIGETLLFKEGFIENGDGEKLEFTGRLENLLNEQRSLKINSNKISLPVVKSILNPILPDSVRGGELRGDGKLDMVFDHALHKNVSWSGKLSLANTSFAGVISGIPISVNGVNGVITFDEYGESRNLLASLLREHHKLDKEVFERFLSLLNDTEIYGKNDFLTIDEIKYGFLSFDDIECMFSISQLRLNLNQCSSNLFDGRIFLAGAFNYGGKEDKYNLSVLLKDIGLGDISNRVNSIKDYITGRINGLVWLNGKGTELDTIDGLFEFWSIKSKRESRRLGKALLEKLGAKSRFFLGSSRRYDRGEISGYIKDGVLTFSEFDISNSIFGYENLSIKVDPRRNTISLNHMLSVIREISKRAKEGQLQIDLGNKRN